MSRITIAHLEGLVNRLNVLTGSPLTYSSRENGKFKSHVGHYCLDQAYSGVKLQRVVNEGGGVSNPISMGYETKKDAYYIIAAFVAGVESQCTQ